MTAYVSLPGPIPTPPLVMEIQSLVVNAVHWHLAPTLVTVIPPEPVPYPWVRVVGDNLAAQGTMSTAMGAEIASSPAASVTRTRTRRFPKSR